MAPPLPRDLEPDDVRRARKLAERNALAVGIMIGSLAGGAVAIVFVSLFAGDWGFWSRLLLVLVLAGLAALTGWLYRAFRH